MGLMLLFVIVFSIKNDNEFTNDIDVVFVVVIEDTLNKLWDNPSPTNYYTTVHSRMYPV